jgi:hypothetical protein
MIPLAIRGILNMAYQRFQIAPSLVYFPAANQALYYPPPPTILCKAWELRLRATRPATDSTG